MTALEASTPDRIWLSAGDCRLDEFAALRRLHTDPGDYPFAAGVDRDVLIYDGEQLRREVIDDPARGRALQAEWVAAMLDGPGMVVFKRAFEDHHRRRPGDRRVRRDDRRRSGPRAVPPATTSRKPGANDRVWNALEKLALRAPGGVRRRTTPTTSSRWSAKAWLGPATRSPRRSTSSTRVARRRIPHRDYHLGFLTDEVAEQYPAHVHRAVAGADPAGRGGPLRHADRERADDATCPTRSGTARLPRLAAARVHGVLRRAPRAAAAAQGRRGVLQSGAVPRRRVEPSRPTSADGQPAAGLLRVRPGDGGRRPPRDGAAPSIRRCCGRAPRRAPSALATASPQPPRATRSRPTSTSISRSAGWLRLSQADLVRDALAANVSPAELADQLDRHAGRRRTA